MVNIDESELKKLVEQGVRGNANGFSLLSKRLVSKLKKSNSLLATELSEIISQAGALRGAVKLPAPVDSDSRRNLLQESYPVVLDAEPHWDEATFKKFQQVIVEHNRVKDLADAGLSPIRSLLLSGPPGVGKTLSAYWLAYKLDLPLLTLDLASVMSSLLGKTGSNIRAVIDYARGFPCVLLLDEFDAVAKKRDDERDVGELKRLVTVLLQAIDDWPASSVLIAATNHPDILDPAVWRRFDLVVDMGNPTAEMILKYLTQSEVTFALASKLAPLIVGTSFALLEKIILSAKKQSILEEIPFEACLIQHVLNAIIKDDSDKIKELKVVQLHLQGLSLRKIAENVGITHPTASKIVKKLT